VDGQRLFIEPNRAPDIAQLSISTPQVAQVITFSAPVADLAVDGQCLFMIPNGAPGIA